MKPSITSAHFGELPRIVKFSRHPQLARQECREALVPGRMTFREAVALAQKNKGCDWWPKKK